MSKHGKANDDPNPGGKGGKPASASGPSAHKAGSPAGKAARSAAPMQEPSWTEVANFVVTFECREPGAGASVERRITAHKMQDDGITAKWTGVAQQPMCEWIADHVGDWAGAESAEPAPTEGAGPSRGPSSPSLEPALSGLGLAISQLRALHAAAPLVLNDGTGSEAAAAEPGATGRTFDLEALIDITGLRRAESLQAPAACSVKFFSRNAVTSESSRLGEITIADIVEGKSPYKARLSQVRLPAGTYRVESVATLTGPQTKLAYRQGPLLQVA